MDWSQAVERNLAALLRIADALCAMAGLGDDAAPGALRTPWPTSLPRHLHAAVLSVLRPAEAALRRLVVIAARDLVITLSPSERARLARAALPAHTSRTGIFVSGSAARPEDLAGITRDGNRAGDSGGRPPNFALFDPLKRFGAVRQGRSQAIPRILFDLNARLPDAPPSRQAPAPDNPVNAARLCRRLSALKSALDDLQAQARRLARWRARRGLRGHGRLSPLRPGPPPGYHRDGLHPVDAVLSRCHGLAIDAVARRDTS